LTLSLFKCVSISNVIEKCRHCVAHDLALTIDRDEMITNDDNSTVPEAETCQQGRRQQTKEAPASTLIVF